MFWKSASALCLFSALIFADTLMLRSGRSVQGQYLGGDSRQIRMDLGDRIENFPVGDVTSLQFGGASRPVLQERGPDRERERDQDRDRARTSEPILRPERNYDSGAARSRDDAAMSSLEIPAGTQLVVRMVDDVDSSRDTVGKTFRASLEEPVIVNGQTVVPRGADVVAKLVNDQRSGRIEGRTVLTLDLAQIGVNGRMVDINTEEVTQSSTSRGSRSAKVIGGTAALGALLGAVAGGGRGAAIGGLSGGAVGTGVQVLTKGQRVKIPTETRLTFTTQQATRL